ncbi:C1 family peptidase [Roseimarinus sediminis]|uniref:aminopeptidase C n=1 Tax=Roseimarinus sediminis TaxID=1610899 RepID=UPI003D1EFD03
MKIRFYLAVISLLLATFNIVSAQNQKDEKSGYQFTPLVELEATPVEDQHRTGTCWSYSALSFLESELIRMGKPVVDLSEMFVVWHCYSHKAEKYVRMHGNTNFGPGGAFHDVTWVLKNHGLLPESAYTGLVIDEEKPVHGEMDEILRSNVESVVKNKNRKLSPVWNNAFDDLLNNYLGELPETFEYEGVAYTPRSFSRDYLQINPDDYIEIGSFTHHPFYEKFIIEIPDNWLWDEIYNVPLDEMMEIIDYALENGYTIAWGADVSDKGFATKDKGVAVVPDVDVTEMSDSEISKWENMNEKQRQDELYKLDGPGSEKTITQEMRQIDFDNFTSTDDHGMHIIGTAKDQNGTVYYKVKNSWGEYNDFNGYFYASKPYVALRTIDFMIHKDAIPKKIAKKLGIN